MPSDMLPEPAAPMTAEEFRAEMAVMVTGFLGAKGNEVHSPSLWHEMFAQWVEPYVTESTDQGGVRDREV